MTNGAAIVADRLTKIFKSGRDQKAAVDDVSFRLDVGQSIAFLGANGAGKSTTVKMLCGILTPTSGNAYILGQKSGTIAANRSLGLVFGTRSQLFMHMTVRESLDLSAEIYSITGPKKLQRIGHLSNFFGIDNLLNRRARSLSLGERMRCEVVAALIHNPAVLLADEPTIGLDLIAKNQLRELLRKWQQTERTALMLTSHDIADIEALCDRCILIENGKIEFDGLLLDLKGATRSIRRIRISVSESSTQPVTNLDDCRLIARDGDFSFTYEVNTERMPIDKAVALVCGHYRNVIQDIQVAEIPLSDIIRQKLEKGLAHE